MTRICDLNDVSKYEHSFKNVIREMEAAFVVLA